MTTSPDERTNLLLLLLEIEEQGRSGVLRFERGTVKRQLAVSAGKLAYAESNVPEEHLARILLRLERISRTELLEISAQMKAGMRSDEAARTAGKLTAEALAEGLREQAVTTMAAILGWQQSSCRFYADVPLPRTVALQLALPELLVEAARRAARGRSSTAGRAELFVTSDPRVRRAPARLPLDAVESGFWTRLQQPTSSGGLLGAHSRGPVPAEELLERLLLIGLVRVEERAPETADPLFERVETMLRVFEVASCYEILSVPAEASADEIQAAYHELAKELHPDRFQSRDVSDHMRAQVETLFTYINGAYTTLSDPAERARYDAERATTSSQVEVAVRARAGSDAEDEKIAAAMFRAGRTALARRDYAAAVGHLKECVWLRPDSARYQHFLGVAQTEIPNLRKEAEGHLRRALEIDHTAIESHLALGKLYVAVNLPKRAEMQFAEVLRWDPNHAEAKRMLAAVAGRKGRPSTLKG